jgi:Tfp pilus assembly protein PilN
MRRIDLDYRARKPWLGWGLLSLGAVMAGASALAYVSLANEAGQWQAVAEKAAQRPKAIPASRAGQDDAVRSAQEIEQANEVIRRLSLPWHELFIAMESSAIDKVALLSVQPDPQQRIVNLNGEAQAYADVLTYMLKLDASGALTRVRLLNHEVKRDDPQHPVAFTVTARWRITS